MHLRQSDNERKLILLHIDLEQSPSSDDLQRRQNNPPDIHMRNQNITSDFSNVLQEAEIEILVLQPSQFQISVDVSAVGVSVAKVAVVVFAVVGNGHAAVRADADWKKKNVGLLV